MKKALLILFVFCLSQNVFSQTAKKIKQVNETYFELLNDNLEKSESNELMIFGTFYENFANPYKGSMHDNSVETIYKFVDNKLVSENHIRPKRSNKLLIYKYQNNQLSEIYVNEKVLYYCYTKIINGQKFVKFSNNGEEDMFIFKNTSDVHPSYCLTSKNGVMLYDYDKDARILTINTSDFEANLYYNKNNDIIKVTNYFGIDININYEYDSNNNWTNKTIKVDNKTYQVVRDIQYY